MEYQDSSVVPSVFDEVEQELVYATTGQRFVNYIIDTLLSYGVVFVFFAALAIVLRTLGMEEDTLLNLFNNSLFSFLVAFIVGILYFTLLEGATKGRTLGKLITGTIAIRDDRAPITFKDAFLRSASRYVPFEPFSGLSGYPWHDKWTQTVVVKKSSYNKSPF